MFTKFLKEEKVNNGAQVIEYALIIAMISIALALALQTQTIGASFSSFIGRVHACLTTAPCI